MKKIFTLVAMAAMAIGVNAQEMSQTFSVDGGDFNTTDPGQAIQVKNEAGKALVNVQILSSPNLNQIYNDDGGNGESVEPKFDYTKVKDGAYWEKKGGEATTQSLAALNPKYTSYLIGKGNPALTHREFWEWSSNDSKWSYKYDETYYDPTCGKLPIQGEYIRITAIVDGTFEVGIFMNKNNPAIYVIDESTEGKTPLAPSSFTIKGYLNNNTWTGYKNAAGDPYPTPYTLPMKDDYTIMPVDETQSDGRLINQQFLGTMTFNVKKGVSYIIMNAKSQLGFYGFKYTYDKAAADAADPLPEPVIPTGIEAVKAAKKADAAIYNLAGQKVDAAFKGMVIMNGKKFINK